MESTNCIEYVREKLHEKGIDLYTQDYVIEYIEMNQKLFGNFLDINKVIDRIISNLDHSVKTSTDIRSIAKREGLWNAYEHMIYINPLKNLFKRIKWIKPIIMHELDHCATTIYRDMEDEENERYIAKCLNNSSSSLKTKKLENFSINILKELM